MGSCKLTRAIAALTALASVHAYAADAPRMGTGRAEEWAKLPPGRTWEASPSVEIDSDGGNVWVVDRCVEIGPCSSTLPNPLQKFDARGNLVAALGAGMFVSPHGLFIDRDGNLWVTDYLAKDGKGQTVTKLSQNGKVLMVLGTPGKAGDGPNEFNAPSDVIIGNNGDIFVADGHGPKTNHRIVKFSRYGKFIKAWGKEGSGPGEFGVPHALAIDRDGRLLVADRENNRIQVFDQDGNYITSFDGFGDPSGIAIDAKNNLYAVGSTSKGPADVKGVRVGNAATGEVTALYPNIPGWEGVAVDREGRIFTSSITEKNLRRVTLD